MRHQFTLTQKGFILILVPLVFELVSFVWLYSALSSAENEIERESHAKSVLEHVSGLYQNVVQATTCLIFYRLSKSENLQERYQRAISAIIDQFDAFRELQKDNPVELQTIKLLEAAVDRAVMHLEQARRAFETGDQQRQIYNMRALTEMLPSVAEQIAQMSVHYRDIARSAPQHEQQRRQLLKNLVVVAISLSFLLAAALYLYFNRDTARRLAVLMLNTKRFGKAEPLPEAMAGGDEIAQLDGVFHQMVDALTAAARRKQEFMAMVAHDLRSPLAGVHSLQSTLIAGFHGEQLPGRMRETVELCQQNLERVLKLINDLLDAEKLAAGKMEMRFAATVLSSVVGTAVQAIRPLADKKRLVIVVPSAEIIIFADGDRLQQVVINLLSNSVKFSPEEREIKISAKEDGDWLEIRISDEGPGIPAGELEKIFERFEQSSSSAYRVKGGTGLGLAICKDIIGQHHGQIGVESEDAKGSTFWFRIPATMESMKKAVITDKTGCAG